MQYSTTHSTSKELRFGLGKYHNHCQAQALKELELDMQMMGDAYEYLSV